MIKFSFLQSSFHYFSLFSLTRKSWNLRKVVIDLFLWLALWNSACSSWNDGTWTFWCWENNLYSDFDESNEYVLCSSSWITYESESYYCSSDVWKAWCCYKWLDRWNIFSSLEKNIENKKSKYINFFLLFYYYKNPMAMGDIYFIQL